jgi:hypothetical protein
MEQVGLDVRRALPPPSVLSLRFFTPSGISLRTLGRAEIQEDVAGLCIVGAAPPDARRRHGEIPAARGRRCDRALTCAGPAVVNTYKSRPLGIINGRFGGAKPSSYPHSPSPMVCLKK